ncbi:hypothetical protein HL653_04255 [Sphingomonas sp. AP4-R1]|uniref:hypothetical protein n=1 Tax=Sphingomonas sp. AP4-R1 TaxID=2735134 RepID=UPI0014937B16|nr:hypothetical protein [Sphingomonas sp. AP4-R1]QJU57102.1 hypothetical protein HL653_04255 [Sphingomonas sp. AP4-R1]
MDLLSDYIALTGAIVRLAGSDKIVHTYAGLAIYVLAQVALRTRRASPVAFQIVVALELANEVMDRLFWGSWRWSDTIGDVAATVFWPGALCLLGYYRRTRWRIEEAAAKAVRDQKKALVAKSSDSSRRRPVPDFAASR